MIDNVMLLLKGTLSGRSASELIKQCHPLGMFKVRTHAHAKRAHTHTYCEAAHARAHARTLPPTEHGQPPALLACVRACPHVRSTRIPPTRPIQKAAPRDAALCPSSRAGQANPLPLRAGDSD